jgi:hypothetical protein
MSKGAHDVFALVINLLGFDWRPKHIIILGFFEVFEIIRQTLTKLLIHFLDEYGLKKKIMTYVKDEGSNRNTMRSAFKSIMK